MVGIIHALERTQVKAEVCNQVKAEDARAEFLDLPDDLSEDWWRAGQPNRKLLVRSCYNPIFDLVWEHNQVLAKRQKCRNSGVVLLGNPGIGKTGFLWMSLWKLLRKRCNIIIKLPTMSGYICVSWMNDKLKVEQHSRIPETRYERHEDLPWYLADRSIPNWDWSFKCKYLLTCSPKKDNYYEFAKGGNVIKLFDPVWTEDELLALNEHNFGHDPEEVRKRFLKWGGIPRYVLQKISPDAQAEITEAIGLVTNFEQIVNLQALPEDQLKAFHMVVDESTFTSFRLAPASAYVEQQLLSNLPLPDLKPFLSVEQPDGIRDIQGKLLENFVCDIIIPRGGKLQFRELQEDGEFGSVLQGSFSEVVPRYLLEAKGHEAVFPAQIPCDHKDALFRPSARNVEWDFVVHGSIYQVTVQKQRELVLGPNVEKALDFLRKYYGKEKEVEFNILVPRFNLNVFTINWFGTIKPEKKENAEKAAKKHTSKDKCGIVDQVMHTIKRLNIKVRLVSVDIGDVCPSCMGSGIVEKEDKDGIVGSLSTFSLSSSTTP